MGEMMEDDQIYFTPLKTRKLVHIMKDCIYNIEKRERERERADIYCSVFVGFQHFMYQYYGGIYSSIV